jgi:hypothetical protein
MGTQSQPDLNLSFGEEEGIEIDVNVIQEPSETPPVSSLRKGDIVLLSILFPEKEPYHTIATLTERNVEDELIQLTTEDNQVFDLIYTQENELIYSTDTYTIQSFAVVEEINDTDLDQPKLMLTKDFYQEIELNVTELETNKVYSLYEQKQSLLTQLISSFKAHGNEPLLHSINESVNAFEVMIKKANEEPHDYRDVFPFLKELNNKETTHYPSWFIPIVSSDKRLFPTEEEALLENDGTYHVDFEDYLDQYQESLDIDRNPNYKQWVQNLQGFKPYRSSNRIPSITHNGPYFRECNQDSPCYGIKNTYFPDNLRTNKSLTVPIFEKDRTSFETVITSDKLSLRGFHCFPPSFLSETLSKDSLELYEYSLLDEIRYSPIPFSKRMKQYPTLPTIMNEDTLPLIYLQPNHIHTFMLSDGITTNNLGDLLTKQIPSQIDFFNTIPKIHQSQIVSHNDFRLLSLPYGISIKTLGAEERSLMNNQIKTNIDNYIQSYNRMIRRKPMKKLKKIKRTLSDKEKIDYIKQYIRQTTKIIERNLYIQKTIDRFGRNANELENPNFIYQKQTEEPLFCIHYRYLCKTHKEPEAFLTLRSKYGLPPTEGMICCKICGEYICQEEETPFQGYTEGAVTLEVAREEPEDVLTEEEMKLSEKIKTISSLLSLDLTSYDVKQMISYLQLVSLEDFVNYRYQMVPAFQNHPRYNDIKTQFNPANAQNKQQKTKLKQERVNELKKFKQYIQDSNQILLVSFLCLFYLQVSIPPYVTSMKQNLRLFNPFTQGITWNDVSTNIKDFVSVFSVDRMFLLLKDYAMQQTNDTYWKHCYQFITESDTMDVLSFKEQFTRTSSYILRNEKFKQLLKLYFDYQTSSVKNIYLKGDWPSYKPQQDNETVQQIQSKITLTDDLFPYLLKKGSEINYENISSIISIEYSFLNPHYKRLGVPSSEILTNGAFQRLFHSCIHLYGESSTESPTLNLQIQRLLKTTSIPSSFFEAIGWNPETNTLQPISYNDLRKVVLSDIIQYYKQSESVSQVLDTVVHIGLNNWNGMLLATYPKRNYSYQDPVVYPQDTFEDLLEIHPGLIQKIYQRYCYDKDKDIQVRYSVDDFIMNLVADPSIDREASCQETIKQSKETFRDILSFKQQQSKHPLYSFPFKGPSEIIPQRFIQYIEQNGLLTKTGLPEYPLYQKLANYSTLDNPSEQLNVVLSGFVSQNEENKERIQTFFQTHRQMLRKDQIRRYQSLFGRSIDSLSFVITKTLSDPKQIHQSLLKLYRCLGRLSHESEENGTVFHTHLPKQWKLSENNKSHFKDFLSQKEFLLHNDLFTPTTKEIGFYRYLKEPSNKLCFQGLQSTLLVYKGLSYILSDESSLFTQDSKLIFDENQLVSSLCSVIDYIDNLEEMNVDTIRETSEVYSSLLQRDANIRKRCVPTMTQFLFDVILNLLEEYIDPAWIYQEKHNLSDKLSKQREREKQTIIDDLESKTDDARLVTGFLQNFGLAEGQYHSAERANIEYIESQVYEQRIQEESVLVAQSLFKDNDEVGYDPVDLDREDEGLDDNDDDGDYHEN